MASRLLEAKVMLLIWLFSASAIGSATVSLATSIYSDALSLSADNVELEEDCPEQRGGLFSQPSAEEGKT